MAEAGERDAAVSFDAYLWRSQFTAESASANKGLSTSRRREYAYEIATSAEITRRGRYSPTLAIAAPLPGYDHTRRFSNTGATACG